MKTKLHFKVLLILLIPVIYFVITAGFREKESIISKAVSIADNPITKDFTNLIFTDKYFGRYDPNDPRAIEKNITNIKDSLHFNSVHIYGYDSSGGKFDEPISNYSAYISGLMKQVKDSGLNGYYGRWKIERLCYGQRLMYEAEGGNNGFSYSNNSGYVTTDSGRQVVKGCLNTSQCPETDATPRYLCQNIYENLQHGDLIDFTQLDTAEWFIKPVMRIDSNIVDSNPNDSVVRIDVVNYSGKIIKSVKILAKDFSQNGNLNYSGNYIQRYWTTDTLTVTGETHDTIGLNYGMKYANWGKWKDNCKVDFKVWWYGKVEVWFDKMIVDDEYGDQLFSTDSITKSIMETKIREEVDAFTDPMGNKGSFFIDELTHSNIPCVQRVDSIMKSVRSDAKLNFAVTNYFNIRSYKDNNIGNRELLKQINSESFNADAHEIADAIPNSLNYIDPLIDPHWIQSYADYTRFLQKRVFGDKSKDTGIDTLEQRPDSLWTPDTPSNWGTLVYQIALARKQRDIYSPNKKFIMQPQIQGLLKINDNTGYYSGGVREPLNEEIEAQAMLSIAHGAEGICWFIYYGVPANFKTGTYKIYGLLNLDSINNYPHRHENMYGQDKWKAVGDINLKIEHWKPTMDKINWTSGWSVHKDGADHDFISDIKSIIVHPGPSIACEEDNINYDCQEERYWEMGFFDPDFDNPAVDQYDKSKYFIMVNRRCVPDTPTYGQGDLRQLKIKFDSTQLAGFTNWKLIDLDTNYIVSTFNKSTASYINMGEFKPGEGKLYKLAPVMQEGGTLVADEECGGDIECKGEVNNNGKNIFLKPGTNIRFADHTARIKMEGGVFKSGYSQTQNSPVYLKGKDNSSWKGISLYGCDSVLIKDTHFSNISPYPVDSTYAVDMINCEFINIETGSFISEGDINAGCIRSGYVINEDVDYSACIQGNTFETDEGEIPALSFIATAGLTLPLIIDGNIFTSASSEGSSNAVLLSNISGGVIKNNTVSEYINSIIMLSSSMDLYNNTITSGIDNSAGIQLYSFSTAFLKPSGMYYTGGYNNITNLGDGSRNIELLTSYFNIYKGYNVFNVESNSDYHLIGSLYLSDLTNPTQNAKLNCFQFDGTNTAENQGLVWDNSGMPAEYIFTPYSCEIEAPIAYEVLNIGNRINDTIYYEESGTGGGGKSNYKLGIKNYELKAKAGNSESRINNKEEYTEITFLGSLIDSIGINIRRRNYEKVSEDCMNILTSYPDSLESIGIISKLYLADLRLDSAGNKITGLKTFLESLILNHSYNIALVKQAFYYIQKCKVSLKQYESAMTGFLEIIDENPYSYEGLVASWDFSATSLLFEGGGGAGGGIPNYKLQISNDGSGEDEREISDEEKSQIHNSKSQILNDGSREDEREISNGGKSQIRNSKSQILNDDPNDKYDTKTFTHEDRKIIKENVFNSFELSKEKETEKVRSLEKKVEEGKASKEERTELEKKKTLSETIKARKPADAFEHIKFVNNDIQKVFGVSGRGSEKEPNNITPNEYSLSQNYPNPFNPITHLEFGISNLGFVSLKVYDVLGREIKTLVNEIKPAGIYKIEFDGSNFASGVYFYRLEAGEFVQTKRMVLIK